MKCREDKDRIFISVLDSHVSEAVIRDHFAPYGRVKHVKLPIDHKTGRQRDIAMVTMDSAESVNRALREASRTIMGREVKQMCVGRTPLVLRIACSNKDLNIVLITSIWHYLLFVCLFVCFTHSFSNFEVIFSSRLGIWYFISG